MKFYKLICKGQYYRLFTRDIKYFMNTIQSIHEQSAKPFTIVNTINHWAIISQGLISA